MEVNRKLFLLSDIYGILSYSETLEQIQFFKNSKEDFTNVLGQAERFKVMLEETEQDITDVEDKILKISIQLLYIQKNIETFLDALSLCEDEIVHNDYLPNLKGWVEICEN